MEINVQSARSEGTDLENQSHFLLFPASVDAAALPAGVGAWLPAQDGG